MQSHFKFSNKQRSGIFLLLFLIMILQCVYFFASFSSEEISINQLELKRFLNEIDSLRLIEI